MRYEFKAKREAPLLVEERFNLVCKGGLGWYIKTKNFGWPRSYRFSTNIPQENFLDLIMCFKKS